MPLQGNTICTLRRNSRQKKIKHNCKCQQTIKYDRSTFWNWTPDDNMKECHFRNDWVHFELQLTADVAAEENSARVFKGTKMDREDERSIILRPVRTGSVAVAELVQAAFKTFPYVEARAMQCPSHTQSINQIGSII